MAEKKANPNLRFYEVLKVVPEEAKKKIEGGRISGMTDINPQWRIGMMTDVFGPCGIGWKYEIVKQWQEQYGQEVKAFTNINLYIKVDGEWSEPIPGTGGASTVEINSKGYTYVSDECYKMSLTDALSVAMKALGVGGDIYFSKGVKFFGTKYEAEATPQATPTAGKTAAPKVEPTPAPQPTPVPAPQPSSTGNEPIPLPNALFLIDGETTVAGLMEIWNGCPHLQSIKDFKEALAAKKQQLEQGNQGVSLDSVLKEIERAQDTRDLAAIYTKYPTFQKDANFTGALTARKDQLMNNGKS